MTADIAALRDRFASQVDPDNAFSVRWRQALVDTPRELFVPHFFRPRADGPGWRIVEHDDPEWAMGVLTNTPLITQLNGDGTAADGLRAGRRVDGWATSSSSQPSLMLLMLEALDIRPGHRVLEIGTGTGYNAALLSHGIGSANVTSMDVDPVIVEEARVRPADLGHRPHPVVGDGSAGHPQCAPYDRIMATVALRRLPHHWIGQVREGGHILFPLDTRSGGGIMPLLVVDGTTASGQFLPTFGGFMPVRAQHRHDAAAAAFRTVDIDDAAARPTDLSHLPVTDDRHPFQFFAAMLTGGIDVLTFNPTSGRPSQTWLALPDGSWTCHTTDSGEHLVRQGGPRRLWDEVELLHREWTELAEPARDRFGLTVDGTRHEVWLDEPGGRHRWSLPA
jgi:methyltransferase of ATP-grasp peptide maturase system